MGEPFIGEIKMAGFAFPPRGWASCDGAILPIEQNQAFYMVLGNEFGGGGRVSFGLPDMRGRVPMHPGEWSRRGGGGGSETASLQLPQIPAHTHSFYALGANAKYSTGGKKGGRLFAVEENDDFYTAPDNLTSMSSGTSTDAGESVPHNNVQPSLVINFIIALDGVRLPQP